MAPSTKTLKTLVIAATPASLGPRPPEVTVVAWLKVRDAAWRGFEAYDRIVVYPPPLYAGPERDGRGRVVRGLLRRAGGGGQITLLLPCASTHAPDGIDDVWNEARYLVEEVTGCSIEPLSLYESPRVVDMAPSARTSLRDYLDHNPPTGVLLTRAIEHHTQPHVTALAGIARLLERPAVIHGQLGAGGWLVLPAPREAGGYTMAQLLRVSESTFEAMDAGDPGADPSNAHGIAPTPTDAVAECSHSRDVEGDNGTKPQYLISISPKLITVNFCEESCPFPRLKGLLQISELLCAPGKQISSIALEKLDCAHASIGEETADDEASEAVRKSIVELENTERRTVAQQRRLQQFKQYLGGARGRKGARRMGSDLEASRRRVLKNIRGAITKIRNDMPAFAQHLDESIRTGGYCSYSPRVDVRWVVSRK